MCIVIKGRAVLGATTGPPSVQTEARKDVQVRVNRARLGCTWRSSAAGPYFILFLRMGAV